MKQATSLEVTIRTEGTGGMLRVGVRKPIYPEEDGVYLTVEEPPSMEMLMQAHELPSKIAQVYLTVEGAKELARTLGWLTDAFAVVRCTGASGR